MPTISEQLKEEALTIATDSDYKFELAVGLGKLEECYKIVLESESDTKWKQVCARGRMRVYVSTQHTHLSVRGNMRPMRGMCLWMALDVESVTTCGSLWLPSNRGLVF